MLGNIKQTNILKKLELKAKKKKVKLSYYQCTSSQSIIVESKGKQNNFSLCISRDGTITK